MPLARRRRRGGARTDPRGARPVSRVPGSGGRALSPSGPVLAGIVAYWQAPRHLERLRLAWPDDSRFELIIVNNDTPAPLPGGPGRVIEPPGNLGFAGAINYGIEATDAPLVLTLNPDAIPGEGALESLLEGFERFPDAAGLAPALSSPDGTDQHGWQLRALPGVATLFRHSLLLPDPRRSGPPPEAGRPIEQPAAAALALRRRDLSEIGGLDPIFFPAWFEDVDLARRLSDAGKQIRYWPTARFEHALGTSVPRLGYGTFLWLYYRNLGRYLAKHHGRAPALLSRLLLLKASLLRILLLPLRKPERAADRVEALRGLGTLLAGAASGFRRPTSIARDWSAAEPLP